METQVRTPNVIFGQPQRFLVPLFQRSYVWSQELQWEPLWSDIERMAIRLLKKPEDKHAPHFLGAVVVQQAPIPVGELPARMIIDGQQRLTTLQILFNALHAELIRIGALASAGRLEYLIENDKRFCKTDEDRYKVWPTNRDRPAFNEVMAAPSPVDYEVLKYKKARLVQAHRYFSEQARRWLETDGEEQHIQRGEVLEKTVRELLQLVVIDLSADENAQEIFETLNARGAQLTSADLIKNFVFQKLQEIGADVELAYETYWKEFETAFWETEVSAGRLRYQRSSLFINHWLISRTGDEIVSHEVFPQFKRFASDADVPIDDLLRQMSRAASVYRRVTEASENIEGPLNRIGLFAYRMKAMESDVMKSALLTLLDAERPPVLPSVVDSTVDIIESWLTRRMLVRANTKSYNEVAAAIVAVIREAPPHLIDQSLRSYLMSQSAEAKYWPDNDEVKRELLALPIYQKISRSRLRMVLEAIEDFDRGYRPGGRLYAGMRVPRSGYWIEHIMPQNWEASWPAPMEGTLQERAQRIQTLGNLTLLTEKLNIKVSDGPWMGQEKKWAGIREHDLLLLNRHLDSFGNDGWSDESITNRTTALIKQIIEIWSVPPGHKSSLVRDVVLSAHSVSVSDLLSAGLLSVGLAIIPQPLNLQEHLGRILSDGRIDVDGQVFDTPSGAAYHLRKRNTNGWSFWLVDRETKKSLASVRREYLQKISLDSKAVDDDDDEGTEDDLAAA